MWRRWWCLPEGPAGAEAEAEAEAEAGEGASRRRRVVVGHRAKFAVSIADRVCSLGTTLLENREPLGASDRMRPTHSVLRAGEKKVKRGRREREREMRLEQSLRSARFVFLLCKIKKKSLSTFLPSNAIRLLQPLSPPLSRSLPGPTQEKTSHHHGMPRLHRGGCDCPGTSEKNDVFFSFEFGDRCASMATVVVAEV